MNRLDKAIGYVRISTASQADGVSLENQRERIADYCQYKNFELLETIEDIESGGKNKARAGFMDLINCLENENVQAVILYSLERLSRDMLTLLALERLLDEYGVELHTVEGQLDTSTPDGWLNFAMKSFLGEMERRQVKYRTKRAMQFKKSRSEVVGSIPYGCDRNGTDLVENPQEQKVISRANRLYAAGKCLAEICRDLNKRGNKTRTGKNFTSQQVKNNMA